MSDYAKCESCGNDTFVKTVTTTIKVRGSKMVKTETDEWCCEDCGKPLVLA